MTFTDYLQEVLHQFGQVLMGPVIILLCVLVIIAVWSIGSILVEYFAERRHFKVKTPDAINAIEEAPYRGLNSVICRSDLLWDQKRALLMVTNNAGLPEDALFAMAKSEIATADARFRKKVGRTDLLTKISPMMGLMATLIPLGPGIVAMGLGDVATLSASLGIAFDGTVAGLVSAVVSMCVSHFRKRWYSEYRTALESLMTTLLEKIDLEREAGTRLPYGFTEDDLERYKEALKAASKEPRKRSRSDESAESEGAK